MASKCFIKITNQMIYDKLEIIISDINKIKTRIGWHTWAISALFALVIAILANNLR